MTIISHQHRFVYVAVPKTGSHSIRFALRDQLGPDDEEQVSLFVQRRINYPPFTHAEHGHQRASEIREALGAERWSSYFSFAVVRNPWDRFVSYVAFMMRDNGWFKADPRGTMRRVLANPQNQSVIHFRPQSDFVCDADDELMVSRICRLEQLQADFDRVCRDIGLLPFKLEVRNPSEHLRYTEYFDEDLVRQVGDRYRRDIANFGYEFGR